MRPDLKRLKEFLYETSYEKLDYDSALKWFESRNSFNGPVVPGCSSLMINGILGRNYDWLYDLTSEFVVKTKGIEGDKHQKYDTLGVCSNVPGLDEPFVESGEDSESYNVLPFYLLDGVNSAGMTVSMNVVPSDRGSNKEIKCYGEEYGRICSIMLPRWILDHYATPEEAGKDLLEHYTIYHPDGLINLGYNIHLLLKNQENRIWIVEFQDNEIKVEEITHKPFMTNFHLIGTKANPDGTYYGPADVPEHTPTKENLITEHAQGVERYNLIVSMLNRNEPILECMKQLLYTRLYQSSKDPANPIWYTEYTTDNYTVDMPYQVFEPLLKEYADIFSRRERNGDTSQTVHTALYDTNSKTAFTMQLWTQEDLDAEPFTFELRLKPSAKKGSTLTYTYPKRNFHNYLNHQGAHVLYFDCLSIEHTDTWPNKTPDGFTLDVGSKLYESDTGKTFDWQGDRWKERQGDQPGPEPEPTMIEVFTNSILGTLEGRTGEQVFKGYVGKKFELRYDITDHPFTYLPTEDYLNEDKFFVYINDRWTNYEVDIRNKIISFDIPEDAEYVAVYYCGADFSIFNFPDVDKIPGDIVPITNNLSVFEKGTHYVVFTVDHFSTENCQFKLEPEDGSQGIKDATFPDTFTNTSIADNIVTFKMLKNDPFNEAQLICPYIEKFFKAVYTGSEVTMYYDRFSHKDDKGTIYLEDQIPLKATKRTDWPWNEGDLTPSENLKSITADKSMEEYDKFESLAFIADMQINLKTFDLEHFNTRNIKTVTRMLNHCFALEHFLIPYGWENCEDFSYMFYYCYQIQFVPWAQENMLWRLDTSSGKNFNFMFGNTMVGELDLRSFNTSNAESYINMFYASSVQKILVSGNFKSVGDEMSSDMFLECNSLVGGKGTKYDKSRITDTMAVIDQDIYSPTKQGYFTRG